MHSGIGEHPFTGPVTVGAAVMHCQAIESTRMRTATMRPVTAQPPRQAAVSVSTVDRQLQIDTDAIEEHLHRNRHQQHAHQPLQRGQCTVSQQLEQ
jgi:hypothetical protein